MKYSCSLPGVKEAKTKICIIRWAVLWTKYIRAELKNPQLCPAKREMVKEGFREEATFVLAIKGHRNRARRLMEMKKVWARQKVDKNRACLRNGKDVWRDQNMVGPASEQQEMALERGPRPRAQGLECRSSWMLGLYSVGCIIPIKVCGQKRTPLYLRRWVVQWWDSWTEGKKAGGYGWTGTMRTKKGSCFQTLTVHTPFPDSWICVGMGELSYLFYVSFIQSLLHLIKPTLKWTFLCRKANRWLLTVKILASP